MRQDHLVDSFVLFVLDHSRADRVAAAHLRTQDRIGYLASIQRHAHNGQVLVLESGMDCDGVQYWNRRHICEASAQAIAALRDDIAEWADGPFQLQIAPMDSEAEYSSVDLATEAHENGHRHLLRPYYPY